MDVALITAIGALVTALAGSVITLFRIRKERDDRRQQFQTKVAEIEAQLLNERVAQRYKTYSEVFKVLGAVRDVPDPAEEHYKSLLQNRDQLQDTEKSILRHLYSDAGLVMGMDTRNALLNVWLSCQLFRASKVTLQQLVGYFFVARRRLRVDLQIIDNKDFTSELEEIRKRYNLEASDKKIAETKNPNYKLWLQ